MEAGNDNCQEAFGDFDLKNLLCDQEETEVPLLTEMVGKLQCICVCCSLMNFSSFPFLGEKPLPQLPGKTAHGKFP